MFLSVHHPHVAGVSRPGRVPPGLRPAAPALDTGLCSCRRTFGVLLLQIDTSIVLLSCDYANIHFKSIEMSIEIAEPNCNFERNHEILIMQGLFVAGLQTCHWQSHYARASPHLWFVYACKSFRTSTLFKI